MHNNERVLIPTQGEWFKLALEAATDKFPEQFIDVGMIRAYVSKIGLDEYGIVINMSNNQVRAAFYVARDNVDYHISCATSTGIDTGIRGGSIIAYKITTESDSVDAQRGIRRKLTQISGRMKQLEKEQSLIDAL